MTCGCRQEPLQKRIDGDMLRLGEAIAERDLKELAGV